MKRKSTIFIAAVAALTVSLTPSVGSAKNGPVYEIDQQQVSSRVAAIEKATGQPVLSGEIAGAAWIAQVPDNWNGDLLVYAHGFRGEGPELTVDPPPAYQFLTEAGYAWAASSYRRNGYDPGIGVIDTKNLTKHMQSMLRREGDLDKTYLAGVSMGGHVTAAAIEKYPNLWDGALPACGVVGDVELFDYFLDYNFGAAAIAGLAPDFTSPDPDWTNTTVPLIKDVLSNDPDGSFTPGTPPIASSWAGGFEQIFLGKDSPLTDEGEEFKDFVEIGSGGERVSFDLAWEYWHGVDGLDGNFFFDLGEGDGTIANRSGRVSQNSDMSYAEEYGADFAFLDDVIARATASNRVRKSQGNQPAPIINGTPSIPVLSIHTTGDLFVPIEMEQIYAQEVIDNGLGDLLVQRAIRDVGHCSFTGAEWVQSYTDLFNWVDNGVKPAGEDLINDISSPTLGCDYTTTGVGGSGFRSRLAPCPT